MSRTDATPEHTKLFINDEWLDSVSGKTFECINPATEEKICDVAEANEEDVNKAVQVAAAAFKRNSPWRKMDASARGKIMMKAADIIEQKASFIAKLNMLDTGKTLNECVASVHGAVVVFRYYAGLADKLGGKTIPSDGDFFTYTRAEPIGVCGVIIPWNFPITLCSWKLGPALACGNTVVLKPSELTPLAALCITAAFAEAGLPKGVLNVVNGFGPVAGAALASHPLVRKVSFTGSVVTGKKILEMAAKDTLKKVTLELGGKSPFVLFPDCDLETASTICHNNVMFNNGQVCCAGTRNYVHADIYDEFVAKSVSCAKARKVGDPTDEGNQAGALISEPQMKKVLAYIEKGKAEGAKLECGGERIGDKGFFVQPTVFSGVTDDMTIAKEEIFGPVQSILKFTDMEDVLDRCNNTEYGLAAAVFTKDMDRALYMAHNLEAGMTWVNCPNISSQTPFGGVKGSGFGRELGEDAMKEFSHLKAVSIKVSSKNS
ncbi:aldehyde dehydrogenase 1A1-like [Watersipora subatra]|uniref:aldehyde dehydrogenase 1A1-like n=1 Tax=Watersipora subatra TaxID=2589382 RepID=UPI00355C90E5